MFFPWVNRGFKQVFIAFIEELERNMNISLRRNVVCRQKNTMNELITANVKEV
jgi:hypothetical protein